METGWSSDNAALNGPASLGPRAGHGSLVATIFQLPTELVVRIFQFALPSVDMCKTLETQLLSYMRTLYKIRLIAKRSQEIVDGTPTFWKFVISTLPPHVNETIIARSKSIPLTIIYTYGVMYTGGPQPSAEDFLGSLAHTFPRWSAYSGPLVLGYFHIPAPHLQTIVLRAGETDIGALDLLGGIAKHLRHVALFRVPIRWKTGLFTELKVLKLVGVFHELTTTHILDALQASPCLEHLELAVGDPTMNHPPSSPVITYPGLQFIHFYRCGDRFAGAILRHIRAPSCTAFCLSALTVSDERNLPIFLNEDLQNFKELLRGIHSRSGSSEIALDGEGFGWYRPPGDANLPAFHVHIPCYRLIHPVSWVEHTLQGDPGLSIHFVFAASIPQQLLESIKSMQCVTRLKIDDLWSVDECLRSLKFIGEPLSTDPSSPSLPRLQELFLAGINWTAQNILDMVCSRFNPSLWEGTERTPLTINVPRGALAAHGRGPRQIFDLTTLTRIRETDGVECFQFVGSEELYGSLAITWDEEISAPVWGWRGL